MQAVSTTRIVFLQHQKLPKLQYGLLALQHPKQINLMVGCCEEPTFGDRNVPPASRCYYFRLPRTWALQQGYHDLWMMSRGGPRGCGHKISLQLRGSAPSGLKIELLLHGHHQSSLMCTFEKCFKVHELFPVYADIFASYAHNALL